MLIIKFTIAFDTFEPQHDKTNNMACAARDRSAWASAQQPGHLPSLIRAFAVHSMGS